MTYRRILHTATLLDNGKVLVAGGLNNRGRDIASAELYDPDTGTWTTTGHMGRARDEHTATLLDNGQVLVAGGGGVFGVRARAGCELYDPATGTWTTTAGMLQARVTHTATLLNDGKVLAAGGTGQRHNLASAELYDPVGQ